MKTTNCDKEYGVPVKAKRFPYSMYCEGDEAVLTMDCAGGIYRRRVMPRTVLAEIAATCRQIHSVIDDASQDASFAGRVPAYPRCIRFADVHALDGVCDISVVASRRGMAIEFCTGVYDIGDSSTPVLVLIDDELLAFA